MKYNLHEALILRGTTVGNAYFFNPTEIKELSRSFRRENCSGPRLRPVAG